MQDQPHATQLCHNTYSSGCQRTQKKTPCMGSDFCCLMRVANAQAQLYDPLSLFNETAKARMRGPVNGKINERAGEGLSMANSPAGGILVQGDPLFATHPDPALMVSQLSQLDDLLHCTRQLETAQHAEDRELNMWKQKCVACEMQQLTIFECED